MSVDALKYVCEAAAQMTPEQHRTEVFNESLRLAAVHAASVFIKIHESDVNHVECDIAILAFMTHIIAQNMALGFVLSKQEI